MKGLMMIRKLVCILLFAHSPLWASGLNILGQHETANPYSTSGWLCDQSAPGGMLGVHFWSDKNEFMGGTLTTQQRGAPWSWFCGNNTSLQFDFKFPTQFMDGTSRLVSAYGIAVDGTSKLLLGSPKRINFPESGKNINIVFDHKNVLASHENIDSIIGTLSDEVSCRNKFCVGINYLNHVPSTADEAHIKYDASRNTGFSPLVNSVEYTQMFQRGPVDIDGGSVVQAQGVEYGIYLDTSKQYETGDDVNISVNNRFQNNAQSPFANNGTGELIYGFEAQVTKSISHNITTAQPSIGFAYGVLRFRNKFKHNDWFYYQAMIFDPRMSASYPKTEAFLDTISGYPIIKTVLNSSVGAQKFSSIGKFSAETTGATWNNYRHFELRITYDQFETQLRSINSLLNGSYEISLNPADYEVYFFDIGPEIHHEAGTPDAAIGMKVRNLQLRIEK
jgi:hypothetical protein